MGANNPFNIVIGGEAGQGLVTVGLLLSKSLVRHGYSVVVTQGYQSRIRGGHNTFAIRVSDRDIAAPQEPIDLLVALTEETVTLHRQELRSGGVIVADDAHAAIQGKAIKVPYEEIAAQRFENVAALGVVAQLVGLDEEAVAQLVEQTFGKKGDDAIAQNRDALRKAYQWAAGHDMPHIKLSHASASAPRLMMNGNDAIVMGALTAGIRFYSFYPMTPSTSIGLGLAAHGRELGVIVEQAEDEIAAINMVLGASFAGAPSMVATSGGGFALMVEGVSLAAMVETPVVIVVAQRPGPATGLPTRTEQADLNFVLHAGHGEFPRAIFAPGTVEECFHLTNKAFHLAEASQGPVFILTDQFLADSYRAVKPFNLDGATAVKVGATERELGNKPYLRYALTESGVSPRILPGLTERLIVQDSDEHTPDGHLTEDLSVRFDMVEKRLRKRDVILDAVVPPTYEGDEKPDLLLVSWGSTWGSVAEAAMKLRRDGRRIAALRFSQVWPLKGNQFIRHLENAKSVIAVEGNATGQFAGLIRRETGFHLEKKILRCDGLPITPEYIVRKLEA